MDAEDPHSGTYGFYSGAADTLDFISQDLATVAGATYRLTYWLASRERRNQTNFRVEWDGAEVDAFTNVNPFGYTEFSFDLLATDTSSTLRFGFFHFFDYWVLDDVSVVLLQAPVLVPEPGTLALFGSALSRPRRDAPPADTLSGRQKGASPASGFVVHFRPDRYARAVEKTGGRFAFGGGPLNPSPSGEQGYRI